MQNILEENLKLLGIKNYIKTNYGKRKEVELNYQVQFHVQKLTVAYHTHAHPITTLLLSHNHSLISPRMRQFCIDRALTQKGGKLEFFLVFLNAYFLFS